MTQQWSELVSGIGGWIAAGGVAAAAALGLRKKFSQNQTEVTSDRIERDQLQRLEAENKRLAAQLEQARDKGLQRPQDAIMIASLESEQQLLMRDLKRLLKRIPPDMRDQLRESGALESSFAMLADVEQRIEPK